MDRKSQFLYQFRAFFVNSNSIPIHFFSIPIPSPIPGIESGIELNSHSIPELTPTLELVLPTNICCGVFVTFSHVYVENLDNNNRDNFTQNAFHVTAISVTNHLSCENKRRPQRPHIQLDFTDTFVPQLPEAYAVIQPVEYLSNGLHVPCISIHNHLIISYMDA